VVTASAVTGSMGVKPILFVQERVGDPAHEPAGSLSRLVRLDPDGTLTILSEGMLNAAQPDVSFDGRTILFAGREHAADSWQIWRMALDGTSRQQLTDLPGDAREPIWLAPAAINSPTFDRRLPWISFVSTAAGVLDDRGREPLPNLYAMSLEETPDRGQIRWQTTYDLGGNGAPTVLRDGRILYSARQRGGWALMTISWAGENLNSFYGSHDGSWAQWSACEWPEQERVVFIESQSDERAGRLASVSWRRPLHSHVVLDATGAYRTPARLQDGSLVVAWRESETGTYGLYRFDVTSGRGELIHDDPDWHDVDAVSLAERATPRSRIPTVDFASVLDVSGFESAGQLQCMNVYETDRPSVTPARGEVTSVRLMEGIPRRIGSSQVGADDDVSSDAAAGEQSWPPAGVRTRSLGVAPVEADGSFYVNVAGDVPFYMETLNAQGQVVDAMRAWMWVRSGDQRGCVGCHENRELTPENRATQALRRAEPANLMGPQAEGAP